MEADVLHFKPVYIQALRGKQSVAGGLAFEDKLQAQWFDFSLESLYYMDSYLLSVFVAREDLDERKVENTVWAVGFYVGEVIRKNANKRYQWKNWSEFFPSQQDILQDTYFQTMGTSAILVTEEETFVLPINQVIKFLQEGPENSLHFFASQEVETADV
jgi:hypothetical protein